MSNIEDVPIEDFSWNDIESIVLPDGREISKQQFFKDLYETQFSHPDPKVREVAGILVAKRYKSFGDTPYDIIVGSFLNK